MIKVRQIWRIIKFTWLQNIDLKKITMIKLFKAGFYKKRKKTYKQISQIKQNIINNWKNINQYS